MKKSMDIFKSWCLAVMGIAAALFLICGCASTDEFDDGSDDVDPFDTLKLSMKLSPPGGVNLKGGGLRKIYVKWPAPAEDIYRYRIERSEHVEGPYKFVANVDPQLMGFVDGAYEGRRLKDSTTYYYRLITILDDDGPRSLPCASLSATTGGPPSPVKNLRVDATGSRAVTLRWGSAAGGGTLTYQIERKFADKPGSFVPVGTTKELSFVDGGTSASTLRDSTKYCYQVITMNDVGAKSDPSDLAEVTTLPPPVPVTGFTGQSGQVRCVPLKWKPSPEQDIVEYRIFCSRDENGEFEELTVVKGRTTSAFIHGGENPGNLEDEATYFYRVRSVNSVGAMSDVGETIKVVTRQIPPEVQGVAVKSNMPREALVTWQLSSDTAVVGYEIWRCLEGEDDWQQIKVLENNKISRYLDRGDEDDPEELGALLDGTNYSYRVIAYNTGDVRSSASPPVTAKTKLIPVTPTGLKASSGLAGVITLEWNKNPESDIKGYQVQASSKESRGFRDFALVSPTSGPVIKAEEADLKVNVTRYYRIKAVANDRLESHWSEVVSGVTKPLPDPPAAPALAAAGASAHFTWASPPQKDIKSYNIWSKKLIGWKLIAESKICEYKFDAPELEGVSVIAVTGVDVDGLESEKSEQVKQEVFTD